MIYSRWRQTRIWGKLCQGFRCHYWWKLMKKKKGYKKVSFSMSAHQWHFFAYTNFLGIMKSSRNPKLLYKSHLFSFECSTLLVVSRSKRIFRRLYFSRIDLNLLSASVAVHEEVESALRQIEKWKSNHENVMTHKHICSSIISPPWEIN